MPPEPGDAREGDVQGILPEFTGLENILSHLGKINFDEVEGVSPETLKGYIAFGALMCYVTTHGDGLSAQELENSWRTLARTLGVEMQQPAEAGAAG